MEIGLNNQRDTHGSQRVAVGNRRSNIEIIADMLRVGENGAGKTEIMYSANMSYSQIQKYLDYLVNQGFIHKVNMDNTLSVQMPILILVLITKKSFFPG